MRKENPFQTYAVVSQIGFIVIVPLVAFSWGGSALIDAFSLPSWLKIVAVLLGVIVMICSLVTYLRQLISRYGENNPEARKPRPQYTDRRDNDYYDDNIKRKL